MFTRRGYDWTARYPAISATAARLRANSFTIDGEAVVCGPYGVAVFDALQRRGTVSWPGLSGWFTGRKLEAALVRQDWAASPFP